MIDERLMKWKVESQAEGKLDSPTEWTFRVYLAASYCRYVRTMIPRCYTIDLLTLLQKYWVVVL